MRLTPELEQTRELHTLYGKCEIATIVILPGTSRYYIGVCRVCGNAYIRETFMGAGNQEGTWRPLPRATAARYVRNERYIQRAGVKRIVSHKRPPMPTRKLP
jgi:hypothetical protein